MKNLCLHERATVPSADTTVLKPLAMLHLHEDPELLYLCQPEHMHTQSTHTHRRTSQRELEDMFTKYGSVQVRGNTHTHTHTHTHGPLGTCVMIDPVGRETVAFARRTCVCVCVLCRSAT
jgi:hypothetical protein